MKRCPQCDREYFDETMSYCLEDGTRLLAAPLRTREVATAVLPSFDVFNAGTIPDHPVRIEPDLTSNNAIAVMPFANMSPDGDIEYFSDGLAEELLNVLAKIRGLRVAARSSAFYFKDKSASIQEIGRALNVATVLEGSIRVAGQRTRISVRLVKVADGYQLWSETYDRTMDDIFAIQDDIARSVVEEIRTRLLDESIHPSTERRIAVEIAEAVKGRSTDAEAQRLMLLGRYFLDRTTREDTIKAIGYFREAIDIDPDYALCWAQLAHAYSLEAGRTWVPFVEGFARSREAALRSLAIEPALAEGHAQLARIQSVFERDFLAAEASYKRAMELAPGNASVLDAASVLAYKLGRYEEALELNRKVLEQNPLSATFWHNLGLTAHAAGRLGESVMAFRRAIELVPNRLVTHALLSLVLLEQGEFDEALKNATAEPEEFFRSWALAIIHFQMGETAKADAEFDAVIGLAEGNAYQVAELYAVRGDADRAFEWLRRADDEHDPGVLHAKVNPRFRSLHTDSRWKPLLHKIGFKD